VVVAALLAAFAYLTLGVSLTASPAAADPIDVERPSRPGKSTPSSDVDSVTMAWRPSVDNVRVAGYVVTLDRTPVTVGATATEHTFEGLAPGDYRVYVRAFDAAGNQGYSIVQYFTVLSSQDRNTSKSDSAAIASALERFVADGNKFTDAGGSRGRGPFNFTNVNMPVKISDTLISGGYLDPSFADVEAQRYYIAHCGTGTTLRAGVFTELPSSDAVSEQDLTNWGSCYTPSYPKVHFVTTRTASEIAAGLALEAPRWLSPVTVSPSAANPQTVDVRWSGVRDAWGYDWEYWRDGVLRNTERIQGVTYQEEYFERAGVGVNFGEWCVRVRAKARDASLNSPWSEMQCIEVGTRDETRPSRPLWAAQDSPSPSSVTIRWGASTDNIGVSIYRVEISSLDLLINLSPAARDHTFRGVAPGRYYVKVRAMDAAGNISSTRGYYATVEVPATPTPRPTATLIPTSTPVPQPTAVPTQRTPRWKSTSAVRTYNASGYPESIDAAIFADSTVDEFTAEFRVDGVLVDTITSDNGRYAYVWFRSPVEDRAGNWCVRVRAQASPGKAQSPWTQERCVTVAFETALEAPRWLNGGDGTRQWQSRLRVDWATVRKATSYTLELRDDGRLVDTMTVTNTAHSSFVEYFELESRNGSLCVRIRANGSAPFTSGPWTTQSCTTIAAPTPMPIPPTPTARPTETPRVALPVPEWTSSNPVRTNNYANGDPLTVFGFFHPIPDATSYQAQVRLDGVLKSTLTIRQGSFSRQALYSISERGLWCIRVRAIGSGSFLTGAWTSQECASNALPMPTPVPPTPTPRPTATPLPATPTPLDQPRAPDLVLNFDTGQLSASWDRVSLNRGYTVTWLDDGVAWTDKSVGRNQETTSVSFGSRRGRICASVTAKAGTTGRADSLPGVYSCLGVVTPTVSTVVVGTPADTTAPYWQPSSPPQIQVAHTTLEPAQGTFGVDLVWKGWWEHPHNGAIVVDGFEVDINDSFRGYVNGTARQQESSLNGPFESFIYIGDLDPTRSHKVGVRVVDGAGNISDTLYGTIPAPAFDDLPAGLQLNVAQQGAPEINTNQPGQQVQEVVTPAISQPTAPTTSTNVGPRLSWDCRNAGFVRTVENRSATVGWNVSPVALGLSFRGTIRHLGEQVGDAEHTDNRGRALRFDDLRPGTTYTVEIEAFDFVNRAVGTCKVTVRTKTTGTGVPVTPTPVPTVTPPPLPTSTPELPPHCTSASDNVPGLNCRDFNTETWVEDHRGSIVWQGWSHSAQDNLRHEVSLIVVACGNSTDACQFGLDPGLSSFRPVVVGGDVVFSDSVTCQGPAFDGNSGNHVCKLRTPDMTFPQYDREQCGSAVAVRIFDASGRLLYTNAQVSKAFICNPYG